MSIVTFYHYIDILSPYPHLRIIKNIIVKSIMKIIFVIYYYIDAYYILHRFSQNELNTRNHTRHHETAIMPN